MKAKYLLFLLILVNISYAAEYSSYEDFENLSEVPQSTLNQDSWWVNGTSPSLVAAKMETSFPPCANFTTHKTLINGSQALVMNITKIDSGCTMDTWEFIEYSGVFAPPTNYSNETNITFDIAIINANLSSVNYNLFIETGIYPDFGQTAGFIDLVGGPADCSLLAITGRSASENMTRFAFKFGDAISRAPGCNGQLDHLFEHLGYGGDLIAFRFNNWMTSSSDTAYSYVIIDNFGINSAPYFTNYFPEAPNEMPTFLNVSYSWLDANHTSYRITINANDLENDSLRYGYECAPWESQPFSGYLVENTYDCFNYSSNITTNALLYVTDDLVPPINSNLLTLAIPSNVVIPPQRSVGGGGSDCGDNQCTRPYEDAINCPEDCAELNLNNTSPVVELPPRFFLFEGFDLIGFLREVFGLIKNWFLNYSPFSFILLALLIWAIISLGKENKKKGKRKRK